MKQQLRAVSRLWLLLTAFLFAQSAWAQVVISQVYGGGGNTNAPYLNDFIEVFNRGTQPVDVTGWSVQYASAAGTTWTVTTLLSGTIQPGHYYLVKEAAGTTNLTAPNLPTPDATGNINLSGTAGKVALVNVTTALSGSCPTGTTIVDFVGFGTANCYEGTGPTPAPSNTTAVLRAMNGCTDTNQNAADFAAGTPTPRNSASPVNSCGSATPTAMLSSNPTTLTGFVATQGSVSPAQTYTLTGSNLDGNPVSVSATAGIELSTNNSTFTPTLSIPATTSAVSQQIYARLTSTAPVGPFSGTITNTANTTLTAAVTVSGQVNAPNAPTLIASPTTLSGFSTPQGTPSAEQTYTLTAANLTSAISVSAPAGVEVSQTTGSGFGSSLTLPMSTTSAIVYVRLMSAIDKPLSGTITNVSGSLSANVAVTGTVSSTGPYSSIATARAGIGSTYLVQGRVTVSTQLGARQIYIQDETGGIAVYGSPPGPDFTTLVNIGDLVQVRGPVTVFSGYLELTGTGNFTVVQGAGTVVPTPIATTPDQLSAYQGQLVSVSNASITPIAATFTSGGTYTITANGQSGVLRISANSPLAGAGQPANPVSVTGIADRFVSGATTTGSNSIQLQPRILADIPGSTPATDQTCTVGSGSTLTRDQTLDIAAWNMEFFGASAGTISCPSGTTYAYGNQGPSNEDLQQSNATTVLTRLNADIISAEEVSDINRFSAAVAGIPGSYSYICSDKFSYFFQDECQQTVNNDGTVFGPTKFAQKVCVIYNTATVTPILAETKALLFQKTPDYTYPGPLGGNGSGNGWASGRLPFLFVANVTLNGITRKIHVVAVHGKSGSASADFNRRVQDYNDLKAELDQNYSTANVVILGDYNDKATSSIYTSSPVSSFNSFVTDVTNYSVVTKPLEQNGCVTYNPSGGSFIDQMIISNDLQKGYLANTAYVLAPFSIPNYTNTTSDHSPIEARFDISQLASPVTALTLVASASPTMLLTTGTTTLSATVSGGTTPYSYTFSGPGTISQSPTSNTASVSGIPAGVQTFTVVARDATTPTSQSITGTVSVTVTQAPPANTPPTATTNANQTATVGMAFSYTVNAFTDAETPTMLTYTASISPMNGFSFNPATRIISGTPSMSGVSSVTITATDPGSLSASTTFTITVMPAGTTPPPTATFSITGVTTISCETISAGQRRLTFTPRYLGTNDTPISFSVVSELSPTTSPGPYTLRLYTDNPVITLSATQSGATTQYAYNWLSACSSSTANTPPSVARPVGPQSATVGLAYTLSLAGVFTDAETPNSLVLAVSGLPAGLSFVSPSTISGTPSMSGVSNVTVTATDPGSLSASTSFSLSVSPAGGTPPPPDGTFSITGVQTISCEVLSVGQRRLTFTPQYTGTNGSPISFSVVNELAPTTNSGPYSLNLYTDNPVITLSGVQSGIVSRFAYNWLSVCSSTTANTPPRVASPVSPQSATVGVGYSVSLAGVFTDSETPNQLTLSVVGLPAGLSFVSPSTITGTPSMSGVSSVTVTATDPGSQSASTSFSITVSPAGGTTPPPSGVFSLTGVTTVSCEVLSAGQRRLTFTPRYGGDNGSPISFSVVNELAPTTNLGPYSLNLYTDNPVITLSAVQSGVSSSFAYNWLSGCAPGTRLGAEPQAGLQLLMLGNPVHQVLDATVTGAEGSRLDLVLTDGQGRVVGQQSIGQARGLERVRFEVSHQSAGMLLLRATTPTQTKTIKVLKVD